MISLIWYQFVAAIVIFAMLLNYVFYLGILKIIFNLRIFEILYRSIYIIGLMKIIITKRRGKNIPSLISFFKIYYANILYKKAKSLIFLKLKKSKINFIEFEFQKRDSFKLQIQDTYRCWANSVFNTNHQFFFKILSLKNLNFQFRHANANWNSVLFVVQIIIYFLILIYNNFIFFCFGFVYKFFDLFNDLSIKIIMSIFKLII